jgi:O-glycosyl hydrolase
MRRVLMLILLLALLGACSSSHKALQPAPVSTTTVVEPPGLAIAKVAPADAQTIEGFGASGAWWPNDLVNFPADVQQLAGKLLFSLTGLQLSGYRYYIGAGGKGVTDPERAEKTVADDTGGLTFLKAASDAQVPLLTGFVYSAPPELTTNGKTCGGSLKPGELPAFTSFVINAVKQIHDQQHVTLQYVSPMNEPDDSFPSCSQEGMQVPVDQRAPMVQSVGKALATDAPYAKEIADETTADSILANEAPQWLSVPGTTQYVAAIAHHTYDFPDDAIRKRVPPVSAQFKKPTWMTEICCYKGSGGVATSQGPGYDPTMFQGLWLADQIYDDFNVAGDTAWYWWTALSPKLGCDPKSNPLCVTQKNTTGQNDGLLYYDANGATDHITTLFPTRRYYVLGQFSRFVRPGAIRHNVSGAPSGVRMMAFRQNDEWTVVAWNETQDSQQVGISLPTVTHELVKRYITNSQYTLLPTGPAPVATSTGKWLASIPGQSVVTYVFR